MKRKSVAVSLITVLLYMLLGSTIACAPSPVQTFYNLTLVARFGGELVYNIEGHTEDSDCPAGRVCMLIGVPRGQVVAITAVPDEGFAFADWTGDVDAIADVNAATIAITMSGNCTIVANFIREIRDWHDLDAIRENLDLNCVLISDLDSTTAGYEALAGPNANGGKGWEPIGTVATGENWMWYYPFTGSLDGRGYEIRDFFINRPEESHIGLFGYIREGVITDVGVVNVTVTGLRLVGGLVGWNEDGTVNNSYAAGSVTGNEYVGGLAGWNYYGTILGSYADGTVTGGWVVGGLVGYNSGNIDSCYSTGTVTGDDGIGGLVGGNDGGTITNCHATGTVTGYDVVGGLVGYNDGEIDSCHAIGDVTGTSDFNPDPPEDYEGGVGGLVGYNTGDIDASHATGSVTHTSWYTGGLVGQNWYGTVSNSYWESTGIVTGTRTVGGLIGYNTGNVDTCYASGDV
ncbi:MAG: hypothetical protein IBX67_04215, partial [Dehalococcoidia bacterium]|nr:hypothetical protein [Dehalococcoidia bacterium]